MKYNADGLYEFLTEWVPKGGVSETPFIKVTALVDDGKNWKSWMFGKAPEPSLIAPSDELPGLMFELSLANDVVDWEYMADSKGVVLGYSIYLAPTKDGSTTISPKLIEYLHKLVKKGEKGRLEDDDPFTDSL